MLFLYHEGKASLKIYTYLLYLLTYFTYLLIYLLTYLLTFLLTYLIQRAESFLRS